LNVDLNYLSSLSGRSMKVTLDGQQKTITFSNKTYNSSDDVTAELQTQLNTAFGAGRITVSQNEDALTLHTDNSILTLNNSGLTGSEASYVIDFADGASNRINLANTLSEANLAVSPGDTVSFRINGKDFSFTSDNTFQEIMNTVNDADIGVVMSYSKTTDTFTLTASETGAASSVTFEDTEGSFLQSILGAGITTNGSNAVVKVGLNGETDVGSLTTLERSSNTFELDGTTYTLLNKAAGVTSEGITINISTDASTIADNINQFVTDYNTLLKTISDKLSEKKYSDYSPLTDSQKAELSDDEIKKWNEKAQSGLLNNDTYLTSIYNSLRSAWSSNVSSLNEDGTTIGTTLSDVGITTGIYSEKGQLKVDKDKLLAALNKDADSVIKFFSQKSSINYSQYASTNQKQQRYAESGLAWRIDDIVRNNLSTTGIKGALIELVGSPSNNFTGKTNYSKQIEDVNEKITELQEKLKDEQNHYWTKFSKMEANLTKLNSLSSWLSSQSSNS
ncbi:MAG: flagellar filament capping protein FliD, partial [Clostridiales bacterium]|nr:flagellar filament capping protein FliD [Clostridiales bacterium]